MNLLWSAHHNLHESSSSFCCTYFKGTLHLQKVKSVMCCMLLELEKSRPLTSQGPISLFCFNFSVQHKMKMSFSPHSQLVLMKAMDLFKWRGKTTVYWVLKANFAFPFKIHLRIELHWSTAGFSVSLPQCTFHKLCKNQWSWSYLLRIWLTFIKLSEVYNAKTIDSMALYYGTSNELEIWAHSAAKDSQTKRVKAFGGNHSHKVNSIQRVKGFWWQEHKKNPHPKTPTKNEFRKGLLSKQNSYI